MSPFSTAKRIIQQVSSSQRLRGEVGWLITHKLIEFPIALLTLKILTRYLGEKGFGEFNLIENAGILVGGLLLTPMLQHYRPPPDRN